MTWIVLALAIPSALLLLLVLLASLARKTPEYHGDDYLAIGEARRFVADTETDVHVEITHPPGLAATTTDRTDTRRARRRRRLAAGNPRLE